MKITTDEGDLVEHTPDAPPGIRTDEELPDKFNQCTAALKDERESLRDVFENLRDAQNISTLLSYVNY